MYTFGINDEEFIRGKVPMTKAEVRAMIMVKARIAPEDTVVDIGAGTGSITVEAALCANKGIVYAIEMNPEGIDLIKQNAEKFGCRNIYPVLGSAPEAMAKLPMTDVVIIGGSGGNMHEILNKATNILRPDGRIVLTSVTAETMGEVVNEFKDRPFTFDGFQMQINRLRKLGRYHLFNPMSPIFIFTAIKKRRFNMAKIYFIGAGPGDPELITIKGQRIIAEADVIIYAGSLVNPEILKYGRKDVPVYNSATMNLDEVLKVELESMHKGKTVARVHTGDPAIYGAIQEQMDGLRAAGVAEEQMEVVPGVSSFLATAAALKQEYTLPNVSQTIIITRMEGRTPMPEKEKLSMLAQHQATMCIFLSIQGINTVMSQLKDGGYPGDTPVAIVVRATWPDQKILRGTIDTIADVIHAEGVVRQAMIVVGRVLDTDYVLSKLYDSSFTTMFRQGTDKK